MVAHDGSPVLVPSYAMLDLWLSNSSGAIFFVEYVYRSPMLGIIPSTPQHSLIVQSSDIYVLDA
jgi:hypothetical protein